MKAKKTLKFISITILCACVYMFQRCNPDKSGRHENAEALDTSGVAGPGYNFKIISSINNTYGYDIYNGNKMMIHQPSVPGMAGNEGFRTSDEAQRVANLVILKLQRNEMPPTVTSAEIDSIKALH